MTKAQSGRRYLSANKPRKGFARILSYGE